MFDRYVKLLDSARAAKLEQIFEEIEKTACNTLEREKVKPERMQLFRSIDIRYLGQGHALTIPISRDEIVDETKSNLARSFDEYHLQTYLNNAPNEPKEIVALRVMAVGLGQKLIFPEIKDGFRDPESSALKTRRDIFMEDRVVSCPIYDRAKLRSKNVIEGPAVIEEIASTILITSGYQCAIDRYGHCVISRPG